MTCLHHLQKYREILQQHGISVEALFAVPDISSIEKSVRKYAPPVVNLLPDSFRYALTNLAKKLRNPDGELRVTYPLAFQECQLIAQALDASEVSPWWGKKAVLCLSHDVDNLEGYRFVSTMAELDAKYGIQSTFNFLTHDYSLDSHLFNALIQGSFEIGLHGDTHDQGMAFRQEDVLRQRLKSACEVLGASEPLGYRSPALSLSPRLLNVLRELGFLYDSTMQIASPFYHSVKLPYPYFLKQYKLWELPLMVQDDNYLRDSKTTGREMLRSIRRFIEECITLHGVLVINMHPHLMVTRQGFYETFLQCVTEYSGELAYVSGKEVITYASQIH